MVRHGDTIEQGRLYSSKDKNTRGIMATLAKRVQISVLNMRISKLLATIVVFALVYLVFRVIRAPADPGEQYGTKKFGQTSMDADEISQYMNAMRDTRPKKCQQNVMDKAMTTVSIILHYNNHQFYEAKLTLHSIIEHTRQDLYIEIILIDDGSHEKDIQQHVAKHLKDKKFHKVKVFRAETSAGEAASKFKAARIAEGEVVVYVSTRTVVNKGWLEPLVEAVVSDSGHLIATPHIDNFLPGYRFHENTKNLVNVFSWTLGTYYYEMPTDRGKDGTKMVNNPVIRGDCFAMKKYHLERFGDIDDGFVNGGGENLELSIRTWLCGGEIKLVPCSRVATHEALRPQLVTIASNVRRIGELWFGDFAHIVYRQSQVPKIPAPDEKVQLDIRKAFLRQILGDTCQSMDWYLDHVAKEFVLPTENSRYFGTLSAETGYCFHGLGAHSTELNLELCRPHTYDPNKIVDMSKSGSITVGLHCLQAEDGDRVMLSLCQANAPAQRWEMGGQGKIHLASDSNKCLTHTSDRNRNTDIVHYATREPCNGDRRQKWTFKNY